MVFNCGSVRRVNMRGCIICYNVGGKKVRGDMKHDSGISNTIIRVLVEDSVFCDVSFRFCLAGNRNGDFSTGADYLSYWVSNSEKSIV